jgi:O-antigen biosynthesis protein
VVLNKGAWWEPPDDPRIFVSPIFLATGVGLLKRHACSLATGDILVELDHDDILTVDALEWIVDTFDANPDAGLVYSDCAQMNEDGSPNDERFAEGNGWTYRQEWMHWRNESGVPGFEYTVCEAKPATPHNVSYIWFAPNHVRAFRRSVYEEIGGYDAALEVCDDADLICRMYQAAPFVHIPELLYLQRVHSAMTQRDTVRNAQIQAETVRIYDEHIQPNALVWAERQGLAAWDLGGAHNLPVGYRPIDKELPPFIDVLEQLANTKDDSVGVIRAVDFLEHVADQITLMNEIYRVLAPGGMFLSLTPSTDGRGAFCDPTHVSFWNELSFRYYCDPEYQKYVPAVTARFKQSRLVTYDEATTSLPYVCFNGTKL